MLHFSNFPSLLPMFLVLCHFSSSPHLLLPQPSISFRDLAILIVFFYEFFCLCVMFVLSFPFSFWQLFALSLPIITMSRVTFGCALYAFHHRPHPICPSQQSYQLLTTHFTICIHISYPCVYHFLHSMCVFLSIPLTFSFFS